MICTVEYVDHMGSDLRVIEARRVSTGLTVEGVTLRGIVNRIKGMAKRKHTSPFEHCFMTVKITCPQRIAAMIMRHRTFSYNGYSRRFTNEDIEAFVPEHFRYQATTNRQSSFGQITGQDEMQIRHVWQSAMEDIITTYRSLISRGVCNEQAAFILPQGTMTYFMMSGNLFNWSKFVNIRIDESAQLELQGIARDIRDLLSQHFPISTEHLVHAQD